MTDEMVGVIIAWAACVACFAFYVYVTKKY